MRRVSIASLAKAALAAFFIAFASYSAIAQQGVAQHGIPVSRGPGAGAFNGVGPCLSGIPVVGAGISADPVCAALTNGGLANANAWTFKCNPTSGAAGIQDCSLSTFSQKVSPATNDKIFIQDAVTGAFMWAQVNAVGSAGAGTVTQLNQGAGVVLSTNPCTATCSVSIAGDVGSNTNCTLATSVGSNNLTLALKTQAGSDPSVTSPCAISFRNSTATTGDYTLVSVTTATSVTLNSGSSLGTSNGVPFRVWVVAFNNSGTVALGVYVATTSSGIYMPSDSVVQSSTACNACAGATSAQTFYTTSAVTSKPFRTLGHLDWASGLATAGVWASGPTTIHNATRDTPRPGAVIQSWYGTNNTQGGPYTSTANTLTATGTSCTFTPTARPNVIQIDVRGSLLVNTTAKTGYVGVLRGGSQVGIAMEAFVNSTTTAGQPVSMLVSEIVPSTASTTWTVGVANTDGTTGIFFPLSANPIAGAVTVCSELQG